MTLSNRLLIALIWLGSLGSAAAQTAVSNIKVETDAQRVKVTYDVTGIIPRDSVYLQIESRSKGILPLKTVTGDVGRNLTPGTGKTIYWDYVLDNVQLNGDIRAFVGVHEVVRPPKPGGGPANALLSVLVPGLGNIMVQPGHKIGLRPLITVAYGGLIAFGLIQKGKSDKEYNLYQSEPYEKNAVPHYDEANRLNNQYVWAIRGAAAVMASDVIYTLIKGIRNQKQQRSQVSLQYIGNTPVVAYRVTF
ncbi:hypothetical protein [Siphonobacter aquaeclarae]|jgi:hypothetical protein|uniref:DUF5683 domain-containing protein n=1 Tax=Siphonobacter aquaeclarae TaxID=563176 RepID=A0A1G9IN79_9BACT|nr:hypothetical protein [Siphonobacter aquaeclarae]MBO9638833.1 hypothetical protein [Siphonobacter aquaeclarae]SDL26555.1 hypothetical protein SAMN04488090_0548 [Siphonobacter aquaeclarae]